MLAPPTPAGFRHSGHGSLLVPVTTERKRQVWTRDERKVLDRMARLVESRGLTWLLKCGREGCNGLMVRQDVNGEDTLRCECSDRVLSRTV